LNQILRRQTSRSHYGSKAPVVTVTVFKMKKEKNQEGLINDTQNDTQDTTKTQEKTQGGLIYAKNQLQITAANPCSSCSNTSV
jgi:hypothetical protein